MLKVGAFLKFLSEINPQLTPARLSFYNYLSHFHDPNSFLSDNELENFFCHSLDYAHWQQNRAQMSQEIQSLIGSFCEKYDVAADFSDVKWPHQIQVLELDNILDITDAIQCYLKFSMRNGEKFRLAIDQNKRIIAIVLNPDQSVIVRHFDRKFVIRHGQLEPLRKNLSLYYTPELDLDAEKTQRLEVAPFVTAQFRITGEGLKGALVRGYLCQKFFDLKGNSLAIYPKLFFSVKRLEQFFLDRETDSFYQETVLALERSSNLVKLGDAEAIQESMDIMARAQNALEYVFTGDKLISLLIRDLQHTLTTRTSGPAVVAAPQTLSMRPTYEAEEDLCLTTPSPKKAQQKPHPNNRTINSPDLTN